MKSRLCNIQRFISAVKKKLKFIGKKIDMFNIFAQNIVGTRSNHRETVPTVYVLYQK